MRWAPPRGATNYLLPGRPGRGPPVLIFRGRKSASRAEGRGGPRLGGGAHQRGVAGASRRGAGPDGRGRAWGGADRTGRADRTRAGVGRGRANVSLRAAFRLWPLGALPLLPPSSAIPRVLACPRREPEPLAGVAAASWALNESAVGGGLRGAARHGSGGLSSALGRSRGLRLLRREPGAEAVAAVAARLSPPPMARSRRRRRC